ncbi:MAG: hypothetical protein QHC40_02235 [Sphingobium sp.]|nr:hypothetical protein [Sphingobium sp.]
MVIQPSHANSPFAGYAPDTPGAPLFWRKRVEEMKRILDSLDAIETLVPLLAGRLDGERTTAVGHTMGAQTVGLLLGARLTDPKDDDARDVNLFDPRIKAKILMAPPGSGGASLSAFAAENFSALNPDFSHMKTQALVVFAITTSIRISPCAVPIGTRTLIT